MRHFSGSNLLECANFADNTAGLLRNEVRFETLFRRRGNRVGGRRTRVFGLGANILINTVGSGGVVGNLQGGQIGTAIVAVPGWCVQGQIFWISRGGGGSNRRVSQRCNVTPRESVLSFFAWKREQYWNPFCSISHCDCFCPLSNTLSPLFSFV